MAASVHPTEILARLPASLDWAVAFRTAMLAELLDPALLAPAFGLPPEAEAGRSTHVVLTSHGRCLARPGGALDWLGAAPAAGDAQGLAARHAGPLALLGLDETADCFAVGALPGGAPPVVMALRVAEGAAQAEAIFAARPDEAHWPLLAAVGVAPEPGEPAGAGGHWRARFRNALPRHLLSGALAGFSRTAHCNAFFLRHGVVDAQLLAGLRAAAAARVEHGRRVALTTAARLALAARQEVLAMTSLPPAGGVALPYGDLVPLGPLLLALETAGAGEPKCAAAATLLRRHLDRHRLGALWPFHRGRLPTATDSALVLLGHGDAEGIAALARFETPEGILPQLSGPERGAETMREAPAVTHWCQPDLGTTCLVRALRRRAGQPAGIGLDLLERRFAARGALFFANPFLMDWALALAIAEEAEAAPLAEALRDELLAAASPEGGFGRYDPALSTALALLALGKLGVADRRIRIGQLRLLDLLAPHAAAPRPFYSTQAAAAEMQPGIAGAGAMRVAGNGAAQIAGSGASQIAGSGASQIAGDGAPQIAGRHWHALTLYEDTHRMLLNAFAALALALPCDDAEEARFAPGAAPHPRYLAPDPEAYVARHALPPYLGAAVAS